MPSRRKLIAMTEGEIAAFLDSRKTLIIVGNGRNGYPHAMPMWFARAEDGGLCCTTFAKSQKVLNWKRDPKATLLVESGEEYAELKGVMIEARCEVVDDGDAVRDTLVAVNSRGRGLNAEQKARLRESVGGAASKRVVLKFTPERYVAWDHAKLGGRY